MKSKFIRYAFSSFEGFAQCWAREIDEGEKKNSDLPVLQMDN